MPPCLPENLNANMNFTEYDGKIFLRTGILDIGYVIFVVVESLVTI